jgi:hypothetical protein
MEGTLTRFHLQAGMMNTFAGIHMRNINQPFIFKLHQG